MDYIKVFTANVCSGRTTADLLNDRIEEWQKTFDPEKPFQIINVHTNSNKYIAMVTITYQL